MQNVINLIHINVFVVNLVSPFGLRCLVSEFFRPCYCAMATRGWNDVMFPERRGSQSQRRTKMEALSFQWRHSTKEWTTLMNLWRTTPVHTYRLSPHLFIFTLFVS